MRKFFIIGHNPNTVKDALEFLDKGANAIEPDVCYHPKENEFYVYDKDKFWEKWFKKKLKLTDYLSGLVSALNQKPRNLALIAFDLKGPYTKGKDNQPPYDINKLYEIIRVNFCNHFPDIAILTTVANYEGRFFLNNITRNQKQNEAIGIDENATSAEVNTFFSDRGLSYTYANGTSSPFTSASAVRFTTDINNAIQLRDAGNSFKLVYVWTLVSEHSMETYLKMNVDGILTNIGRVDELIALLKNQYDDKFEIAPKGYNPFF